MLLEMEQLLKLKGRPDKVTMDKQSPTPLAKKVIEYAIEEARSLNHKYIGTEHILLGLLRESEGIAAQVLVNLGLSIERVRMEILRTGKEIRFRFWLSEDKAGKEAKRRPTGW